MADNSFQSLSGPKQLEVCKATLADFTAWGTMVIPGPLVSLFLGVGLGGEVRKGLGQLRCINWHQHVSYGLLTDKTDRIFTISQK